METFLSRSAQSGDFTTEAGETPASPLLEHMDLLRVEVGLQLTRSKQAEMGQFLTPAAVAGLMAEMMTVDIPDVRLLDAGAGVGSLFTACIAALCRRPKPPRTIHATAYEIEPLFQPFLQTAVTLCKETCERAGISLTVDIRPVDFIQEAVCYLKGDLTAPSKPSFTCAILNPPYRKIHSESSARNLLRQAGIETGNLYTGFLALAFQLLAPQGELIAITPRSFCNGTYFRPFRRLLLENMRLHHIHLFHSRQEAFQDDNVLQETVVLHAVKGAARPEHVILSSSACAEYGAIRSTEHPYESVVYPDDPEQFIRLMLDERSACIAEQMACFRSTLSDLGLTVSTGRVVDFRSKAHLRAQSDSASAPLLYPTNLENGIVRWPQQTRKPQALALCQETEPLFIPNETYVLVKRFSSKEEKRRLVAAVYESGRLPGEYLGLENHLNYFHQSGRGLDLPLARGLALYINSTLLDTYFRQFSGLTQVNATDLRNIPYPSLEQLRALGNRIGAAQVTQEAKDALVQHEIFGCNGKRQEGQTDW